MAIAIATAMEMRWRYFSRSAKSHGKIMSLPGSHGTRCPELQCWMIGFSQGARRVMASAAAAAAAAAVTAGRAQGKTASLDEDA
ncbi:hypothetical protein TMEN_5211 [Trichophyton mentagrophytes]|nr:hypothetical protein TMEN_5211 [Trichophyton mentagrophytes]